MPHGMRPGFISVNASRRTMPRPTSLGPTGKVYAKFAWIFPLAAGLFFITLGGPVLAVYGCSLGCFGPPIPASTPQAALTNLNLLVQEISLCNFSFGILLILVSAFGLRAGRRYAWYVVLWFLSVGVADSALFGVNPPAVIGMVLPAIGLLLSYREVFPGRGNPRVPKAG